MQTVQPLIWAWNNGERANFLDVEWLVQSTVNKGCWPRWFMAIAAATEFLCIVDDDVVLNDAKVLSDAIEILRAYPDQTILGIEGVVLIPGLSYQECDHIRVTDDWRPSITPCDIVKGKFMLMRASAVRENVMLQQLNTTSEDDIAVSAMMASGYCRSHICAGLLRGRFTLIEAPHAIWQRQGHFARRDVAIKKYFKHR
jgi:hypothetical protein